jgi:hypothetical protein
LFLLLIPQISLSQLPDTHVSLNLKNKNIDQVLDELTLQTGYFFTFDTRIISQKEKVDIKLKEVDLKAALDSIFNDPKLNYQLIDKNIVIFEKNRSSSNKPEKEHDKERFRVKGSVIDKQTGEGLAFATLILHGTNKGIISNLQGEFSFFYPDLEGNLILVVSVLGYKNAYVHVDPAISENIVVKLEKDVISLQEVLIRYENPVEILEDLRDNISDNYLPERSTMTAYFRESVKQNKDIVTFSEAVIGIDKSPYTHAFTFDNTQLIRGRKIQNITSEDSILLKIQSGVNSSLQLDIIKNLPDFLQKDYQDYYRYEFRNMVSYRNQYVYHIGFKPADNAKISQYQGDLYINKEDFALLSAEFEVDSRDLRKNPERFLISKSRFIRIKPLKANYKVEYRLTEGKYHLSMVRAEVQFRIRKKGQWLSSQYNITLQMAITGVDPDKRTKIPRPKRLKPNTVLSDEEFSYDPDFWGEYNIIEPEASLQDALKKMGIEWSDF